MLDSSDDRRRPDHEAVPHVAGQGDRIEEPAHDDATERAVASERRLVRDPRAPEHVRVGEQAPLERARNGVVDRARPLASPEHEQRRTRGVETELAQGGRPVAGLEGSGGRRTNRVAEREHLSVFPDPQSGARFGEAEVHLARAPCQPPCRESRERVLLLQRGRDPRTLRAQHHRTGGVTAGADHDRGPLAA